MWCECWSSRRQYWWAFLFATLTCCWAIVIAGKAPAEPASPLTTAMPVPSVQTPDVAPGLPPIRTDSVDESRCPVHRVPLHEEVVAIEWGRFGETNEYRDAQWDLFPFANEFFLGGCVVDQETRAIVHYCPECRRARKQWLAGQPDLDRFGQRRM